MGLHRIGNRFWNRSIRRERANATVKLWVGFEPNSTAPTASDEAKSVAGLADAISGLDKGVLNEVILEVATSEEKKSDPDVRKIKLEVLSHQNEKIREEQAERESAAKKKGSADKAESQKAEKKRVREKNANEEASSFHRNPRIIQINRIH